MRLYDLTQQYQDLLDLMHDDTDTEQIKAMLDGLEGAIGEKVENIIKVSKSLEYDSEILGEEIKRLQARKASIENNRKTLLDNAQGMLESVGLDKLRGKLFNIWVQSNPPSVNIIDESLIPKNYFSSKPFLQRKKIMQDIKDGKEVAGVELTQGKGIRFR